MNYKDDIEAFNSFNQKIKEIRNEIGQVIVGQDDIIHDLLISIYSNGHCLLVGVPGLAKTLMVNTLAKVLGLDFNRIQFTPDLMPSDITGMEILGEDRKFRFIKGPVFANVILADEINRTPPKTQAALLEAMQEKSVTISSNTFKLEEPFFVLATQNPIEQEGTYPLPEAQLDRFMFNLKLDYPSFEEEVNIVKSTTGSSKGQVKPITNKEEILYFQELLRKMPVPDNVYEQAVSLVTSTRPDSSKAHAFTKQYVSWGAGPRASQYLIVGAKVHAAMQGKFSPDKEDLQAVAHAVLRHRIVKNYKAEAENLSMDSIIDELLKA
jgi:MoxR-like ATPase